MTEELTYLHIKSKYLILVEKQPNGCKITYPANYLVQPEIPSIEEKYSFIDDKLIFESEGREVEIKTFGYDNRFLVLIDLVLKAEKRKISNQLIMFFDGLKHKKGILSILPPPNKEFLEKENIIQENCKEIIDRLYIPADAEKAGILEGFNNIHNLVVKGGL